MYDDNEENDVTVQIDQEQDVDNEEDLDPEGPFEYNEDDPNLAFVFMGHSIGKAAARKIVDEAATLFDADWEGSEKHRKQLAKDWQLFAGDLPEKTYPYKNAANPHVPIMLENLSRLTYRAAGELFGNWSSVYGVVPIGAGDEVTADILTKHGNWQIRNQITDFKRQQYRGMLYFFAAGDVTFDSYWDPIRQRNCHDMLTCDEFVTPYVMVSTEPDYSDLPHYSKVMRYYKHELQRMRGIWNDIDKLLKSGIPSWDTEPNAPMVEAVAKTHGIEASEPGSHVPFTIIQWDGWCSYLPNQEDDRFVRVIFEKSTKTLLHLSIHEEDDWQDKMRFQHQMTELEQYRIGKTQYEQQMADMQAQHDNAVAIHTSETSSDFDKANASLKIDEIANTPLPPSPVAPSWMQDPEDPKEMPKRPAKKPIHMFSHGVCIEPLAGSLGLGYGRILADTNRVANVSLSQFVDSAHMANSWSIITRQGVTFEGGLEIAPGKHNKISGGLTGTDLSKEIYELKPPPANAQLFDVVNFAVEYGQSSTQAPGVLSGEPGKSGETYRGVSARIEQATKQLSVVTMKYSECLEQVLKNNARLNAIYLQEEELINVTMDQAATSTAPIRVRRDMYERNYMVEFRSDLRFTSQSQRIAEADEVTAMVGGNPYTAQNLALQYQVLKNSLIARGKQALIPLLGAMPTPPQMFGMPSPELVAMQHAQMQQQQTQQNQSGGKPNQKSNNHGPGDSKKPPPKAD